MPEWEEILCQARNILKDICRVCPDCDGRSCPSAVPGMGGRGAAVGFRRNRAAFGRYHLNLHTLHEASKPRTEVHFFGEKAPWPIFGAPMCETANNFRGRIGDEDFIRAQVAGAAGAGTSAWVGDSPGPVIYSINLKMAREVAGGSSVVIIKPRRQEEIMARIRLAEESGMRAVGIDIDAAAFDNLNRVGETVGPLSGTRLREITSSTALPVVLKGVMTAHEALRALECGVGGLVVSNHGGRALDSTPGTLEVLPEIAAAVQGVVPLFLDGGVRNGEDVFKALALGADAVLIGRPVAIAAIGGGAAAVKTLYERMGQELKRSMLLTGCRDLAAMGPHCLRESGWATP